MAVRPATVCTHPHTAPIGGRESRRRPTLLAGSSPASTDTNPILAGMGYPDSHLLHAGLPVDLFGPLCHLKQHLVNHGHLALQCVDLSPQSVDFCPQMVDLISSRHTPDYQD